MSSNTECIVEAKAVAVKGAVRMAGRAEIGVEIGTGAGELTPSATSAAAAAAMDVQKRSCQNILERSSELTTTIMMKIPAVKLNGYS